ncbi:uncharacterized protein F5Z01DRAFT_273665 [Emericellopsis atlantica]|uniref:Zn(2)-C6 fungal-type domain-containing protein n=1 Tax=Emericellopsis atlantica TaxID=2614577 RepID=A0A9P8CM25_9HYPO|nr:uncharacterized protein F5Z01DRAFT_273665 [Emericellopsis atlantica]KAG9251637.1 hypothetical protein F5Z01DRAFT_273665 [Emericellopsis atlantica]
MDGAETTSRGGCSSVTKSKRKTPACIQCRDRKVRCSGTSPCVNCTRRAERCIFDSDDKKVLVSKRELQELKRKVESIDSEDRLRPPKRRVTASSSHGHRSAHPGDREEVEFADSDDNVDHSMKNPLVVSPSKFLTDARGHKRFLGPSSTWAYSRHVVRILKEHLQYHESPEVPQNPDGVAFPLDIPNNPVNISSLDIGTLPPLDYAIYLTNTVKFHIGQTYHLFDETVFMEKLMSLYENGAELSSMTSRLWLSQYFVIIALGKALLHRGLPKAAPYGKKYFLHAMEILPSVGELYADPVLTIEVCCGIALYLQSVDHRFKAFIYLGIALRVALGCGIHHDSIDGADTQRSNDRQKSAWWTLYILDRKLSYLMGTPTQVSDAAITASLPRNLYASPLKLAALDMHIKLSRLIGKVIDTVYAVDGRLPTSFLRIVQSTLRELARLAETIATSTDLSIDGSIPVNRMSGTLNLCYHQCIILATRPLLMCLLRERLSQQKGVQGKVREIAHPVISLLHASCESANKSLRILSALQSRDLLDSFLPFDLEYAFSAAFILMLTNAIHPFPDVMDSGWFEHALEIIGALEESGSVAARFRLQELERLQEILGLVARHAASSFGEQAQESRQHEHDDLGNIDEGLASADFLSIADMIGRYPIVEMDSNLLGGDWLWETSLQNWDGGDFEDETGLQ